MKYKKLFALTIAVFSFLNTAISQDYFYKKEDLTFGGALHKVVNLHGNKKVFFLNELNTPKPPVFYNSSNRLMLFENDILLKEITVNTGFTKFDLFESQNQLIYVGTKIQDDSIYYHLKVLDSTLNIVKEDSIFLAHEGYNESLFLFSQRNQFLFSKKGLNNRVFFNFNNFENNFSKMIALEYDADFKLIKATYSSDYNPSLEKIDPNSLFNNIHNPKNQIISTDSYLFEYDDSLNLIKETKNPHGYEIWFNGQGIFSNNMQYYYFGQKSFYDSNNNWNRTSYVQLKKNKDLQDFNGDSINTFYNKPDPEDKLMLSNNGSIIFDKDKNFTILGTFYRGDPDSLSVIMIMKLDTNLNLLCSNLWYFPNILISPRSYFQDEEGINYLVGAKLTSKDYVVIEGGFSFGRQVPIILKMGKNCDCNQAKPFVHGVLDSYQNFPSKNYYVVQNFVSNSLIFRRTNDEFNIFDLKVIDMSGKIVLDKKNISTSYSIDITSLTSGMFLYYIFENNKIVSLGKFVKIEI